MDTLLVEGKVRTVMAGKVSVVLECSIGTYHKAAVAVEVEIGITHELTLLTVGRCVLTGRAASLTWLACV